MAKMENIFLLFSNIEHLRFCISLELIISRGLNEYTEKTGVLVVGNIIQHIVGNII